MSRHSGISTSGTFWNNLHIIVKCSYRVPLWSYEELQFSDECRLLRSDAVWPPRILFTLMMEAIRSSETTVLTRATGRHIPEDGILHGHHRESLKSNAFTALFSSWYSDVLMTCRCGTIKFTSDPLQMLHCRTRTLQLHISIHCACLHIS
jgi:hypothetical protein